MEKFVLFQQVPSSTRAPMLRSIALSCWQLSCAAVVVVQNIDSEDEGEEEEEEVQSSRATDEGTSFGKPHFQSSPIPLYRDT